MPTDPRDVQIAAPLELNESLARVADGSSHVLICRDCSAPYGQDGWCDVVIPNEIWNQIAPEGGVICFRCMTKRIEACGLRDVPVLVASGPYRDANEDWRLIGIRHGEKLSAETIAALQAENTRLREALLEARKALQVFVVCGSTSRRDRATTEGTRVIELCDAALAAASAAKQEVGE